MGVSTPPPKHDRVAQHLADLPRDDEVISKQSRVQPWNETEDSTRRIRPITTIIHFGTNGGWFYDNVTGVSKHLDA